MLTRLSEEEWVLVVMVFRACLPRRGDNAWDDRDPRTFSKGLYKGRARIEQAVGELKRFKRIALRCEKTKANFFSFAALAAGLILIKSGCILFMYRAPLAIHEAIPLASRGGP